MKTSAGATQTTLNLIRRGDILAIETVVAGEPRYLGFHAGTLEVAEFQPEIWSVLSREPALLSDTEREALTELETWNAETASSESTTATAPKQPAIRSLTINVAQICNLACTYCAAGGDGTYGSKTKLPELDRVRSQLGTLLAGVPTGAKFVITFLGGEPLLYPDVIRTIVRDARLLVAGQNVELRFDIVTNGTLVTPDIAEMLGSMRAHVTVSIDGAPEENDVARLTKSGKGSSTQILKGLAELVKVKSQLGSLTAGAVFGSHSNEVVKAWKFLSEFPFDFLKFDFAAEAGDELASRRYAQGLSEIADLAFEKGGERELRRIHIFDHLFRALDDRALIKNHCLAGKNHLQLDTEGKLTACQWFVGEADEIIGEGESFDLSLNNPVLAGFAAPLVEKNGCGSCWARHICGGGCMYVNKVKTGNKHKIDHVFCERTRTITAKGIERYAESRYQYTRGTDGVAREIH